MSSLVVWPKKQFFQLCNCFFKTEIKVRLKKDRGFELFCTRGGLQATIYRAKFRNSYVFFMNDYDIYANYKPILLYLMVLFLVCVITQLTVSFLVWGYYSWNACELWMKFNVVLIVSGLCFIYYTSQFFIVTWFSVCLRLMRFFPLDDKL